MPSKPGKRNTTDKSHFCILDVETTGLSARSNKIIEIGIVRVSDMKITDRFSSFVNPGRIIPYYITQFTGITNDDVADAPYFEDIADDISDFLSDSVLTAHNLPFDLSFLRHEFLSVGREFPKNSGLCTLRLARKMYPALRSKSLSSVSKHLRIHNPSEHRALADAEVTAKILIKMIKALDKKEKISTIDELLKYQQFPKTSPSVKKLSKKLEEDFAGIPDAPGIYSFLNSKNEIIYIGKAKSLKQRIASYLSPTAPRKTKKIIRQASRLKIELTNTELTALLTEAQSIKLVKPKHNTFLKQYGHKYFLRIKRTDQYPVIDISNTFDFDGNDYFGLFGTKRKAQTVMDLITRTFALRECEDSEFKKGKACFLAEIERCTAPCVNQDKVKYEEELDKVYDFLYGKNQFALNRLLNKMKEHASRLRFERAAEIKELVDLVLSQTFKSAILREPVNRADVVFEVTEGVNKDFVLLNSGKVYIKKYMIDDNDLFDSALDDYYEGTLNTNNFPSEEDLEKMKIILNWLMKNRHKSKAYYLKDYASKRDLFSQMEHYSDDDSLQTSSVFDLKDLLKENTFTD